MKYTGMIDAATGRNLVEMKKNRTSFTFLIGRTLSPYAHGMASSRTISVEEMLEVNELMRYEPMPRSNTAA